MRYFIRLLFLAQVLVFPFEQVHSQSAEFAYSDSLFAYYLNQDAEKAWMHLERQKEVAIDLEEKAQFWLNKGLFMLRVGQLDTALLANKKGLALTADPARKGRGLRYRSSIFQRIHEQDSSLDCLRRARDVTPSAKIEEHILLNQMLAQSHLRLHQTDSTRYYLDLGWEIFGSEPDTVLYRRKAGFHYLEAQFQLYLSRYESAMSQMDHSLRLYALLGDIPGQAQTLTQMADLFSVQGKQREAVRYYRRAFQTLEAFPDQAMLANYSNNLGLIYLRLEELDSAEFCFRRSASIAREIGLPRLLANASGNLAHIYIQTGPMDSARLYAEASYSEFRRIGDAYGLCLSQIGMAEVSLKSGGTKKAFRYLSEAKATAEALQVPDLKKDVYLALAQSFKEVGGADSALYYYEEHIAIKDSIASQEVRKETERLRIKYETQLKEEENQRLELELLAETEKRRNQRLSFAAIGLLVTLLLVGMVIILYIRNQSRKRQLMVSEAENRREKAERAQVQRRLALALKQITEKDELLQRLESDFQESVSQGTFADKLHERINSNQDWMQFVIEFEMVYKGFFEGLKPQENNLTKNDLRMAALIRLGLSNKEIAEVLNITSEGVKKAKHRLKKKLALPGDSDLSEFVTRLSV